MSTIAQSPEIDSTPDTAAPFLSASSGDEGDASLLSRLSAGDRAAARRFVERHQQAVLRFARALVREDALAEDVLQETFVAALRGAAGFRGGGSARSWLFTIARHAAIRLRPRERPLSEDDDIESLGVAAGWGAEDPESLLSEGESRDRATRALDSMDAEDREVLILRDVEGLSGPETAEVLRLSLPAMKSRLHRARLRFVAALRAAERRALAAPGTPARSTQPETDHDDA